MSDSDDTDFLLLIPPDFFVLRSPSCISPVDYINSVSEISQYNIPYSKAKGPYGTVPVFNSMENEYLNNSLIRSRSYLSASSKELSSDIYPLTTYDLRTEKTGTKNHVSTWPLKTDEFICRSVDTSEKDSNKFRKSTHSVNYTYDPSKADQLANRIFEGSETETSKFNLHEVDKLLGEMEKTRAEIKNKLLSNKNKISEIRKEHSNDFNANELVNGSDTTQQTGIIGSNCSKNFQLQEVKEFDSGENIPMKKQLNIDLNSISRNPKNILHLSKILSKDNDIESLQQKLEAEILKKKHCEEIIQHLQLTLLEQQQNLNVAQKVDAQKEEMIGQLRSSWMELVEHWKELENQRQELALMLEEERVKSRNMKINFNHEIEVLEKRLHEAFSLADGYKEKSDQTEKSLNDFRKNANHRIRQLEDDITKAEQCIKVSELEKREITQKMDQISENLLCEKRKSTSLESQIRELQNQISSSTLENDELAQKYQEERSLANCLKSEIDKLKQDFNRASSAELVAAKEVSVMKQEMTKMKNTLKEFYQKQLDTMLQEKIEEFQKEIEKAETIMRIEIQKQEKIYEEKYQTDISRLKTCHKIELSEERRINQKHVNILKAELKESRRKLYEMENRLKTDLTPKEELSKLIKNILRCQQFGELSTASENADNIFKDLRLLSRHEDNVKNKENRESEDISDIDYFQNKPHSLDVKKYIEMLLDQESDDVENKMNFKNLLNEADKNENSEKKSNKNNRSKPPWK